MHKYKNTLSHTHNLFKNICIVECDIVFNFFLISQISRHNDINNMIFVLYHSVNSVIKNIKVNEPN